MGKYLAIFGGLAAIVGGVVLGALVWWPYFSAIIKGCIPPFLFFGGLIALIAGVSSIKDAQRTKKLEAEAQDEKPADKA